MNKQDVFMDLLENYINIITTDSEESLYLTNVKNEIKQKWIQRYNEADNQKLNELNIINNLFKPRI